MFYLSTDFAFSFKPIYNFFCSFCVCTTFLFSLLIRVCWRITTTHNSYSYYALAHIISNIDDIIMYSSKCFYCKGEIVWCAIKNKFIVREIVAFSREYLLTFRCLFFIHIVIIFNQQYFT